MKPSLELFPDKSREPRPYYIESLIRHGLGYCCEWFFWTQFTNVRTELLAIRLGCAKRTLRRHREAYFEDTFACTERNCCMKKYVNKGAMK